MGQPSSRSAVMIILLIVVPLGLAILLGLAVVAFFLSDANDVATGVGQEIRSIETDIERHDLSGPAVDACLADGGFPATDRSVLLCLGPTALEMPTALESAELTSVAGGPVGVALVLTEGPSGIDGFNQAASECFLTSEACPTGRLAFTVGNTVLSAPTINAAMFARDQIQVTGQPSAVDRLPDEEFARLVVLSDLRPVLWEDALPLQ